MHWFIIALVPPLLWSLVNIIDKFLLSKYLKVEGPGALITFSSIAGVLALPLAITINPNIGSLSIVHIATLIVGGVFSGMALYFYFIALFDEDVSSVVALLQVSPVFGFLLGYLLLGETVSAKEIIASLVIILGAVVLSIEKPESGRFVFKKKLIGIILFSSLFFALYDTLFKFVAIDEDFWVSIFWQNLGLFILGIFFLIISKKYRAQFIALIQSNGRKILSLNLLNEILYISGSIIFSYATLLAPIGLVMTVGAYQPLFVMLGAYVTSRFVVGGNYEYLKCLNKQKIAGIAIIVFGSSLLYLL